MNANEFQALFAGINLAVTAGFYWKLVKRDDERYLNEVSERVQKDAENIFRGYDVLGATPDHYFDYAIETLVGNRKLYREIVTAYSNAYEKRGGLSSKIDPAEFAIQLSEILFEGKDK